MCRDDYSLFGVEIPEDLYRDNRAFERKVERRLVEIVDSIHIPPILIYVNGYNPEGWRNDIFYDLKNTFELRGFDALATELLQYDINIGFRSKENIEKFHEGDIVRTKPQLEKQFKHVFGKITEIRDSGIHKVHIGGGFYPEYINESILELVSEDDEDFHLFDVE